MRYRYKTAYRDADSGYPQAAGSVAGRAVASLIDRSPDTISNLERSISIPTYQTLDALAKGLNIPPADFFLDADDESAVRAEAMAWLTDAARQLDDGMLKTAAAIIKVLAAREN